MIDLVRTYLAADLTHVDAHIASVLDSDNDLMRETCQYTRAAQGKKIRPMLVLLAARACGYGGHDHAKVAAALELVHIATLLTDDVIDKAHLRRGRQTVCARWGDDVAVLLADFIYSAAFQLAAQALEPRVLTVISQTTARMCEGEMFQIEKRHAMLTREDYLRIIRYKTALLFSACTTLGSLVAQAPESQVAILGCYGLNFGLAFQITDDALDFIASDAQIGKPQWNDIRNGKQTLPVIHTLEVAEPADRDDLWTCWNNGRETERIVNHVRKYCGVEHALEQARQFAGEARGNLAGLAPCRETELFGMLADYVVDRRS